MLQFGKLHAILPTLFLSLSGICLAETAPMTAEDKKLLEACLKCHSAASVTANPSIPQLGGQYPQYLLKQVAEYIDNKRAGHEQAPLPKNIDEERWKRITQALSQVTVAYPARPKSDTLDAVIASGKNIYLNGNPASGALQCVQCHGPEGRGRSEKISLFPILSNQTHDYLVAQMNHFRNSERTNDQAFMMRNVARTLSEDEIVAVASYLAYLPSAREVTQDKAAAPPAKPQPAQPEAKPVEDKKEPAPAKESRSKAIEEAKKKEATAPKPVEKPAPPPAVAVAKPLEKPAPAPVETARPAPAGAGNELAAAINRGRDKAIVCEACHGPGGRSTSAVNPNLAGQHAAYLEKQMKAYRNKQRHDAVMTSISESLSDGDIRDLAVYFANSKKK